ncbi:MAG: DUF2283 domain-containing protein [Terriglobia bacterium]
MTYVTYDAEADAVYITVGGGKVDRTEETGPFIYDVDVAGRIVGIEILSASKVLAPGYWKRLVHRIRRALAPPNSSSRPKGG